MPSTAASQLSYVSTRHGQGYGLTVFLSPSQPGQQLPVAPSTGFPAPSGPHKSLELAAGSQAFPGQGFAGPSFSPYSLPPPGEGQNPKP